MPLGKREDIDNDGIDGKQSRYPSGSSVSHAVQTGSMTPAVVALHSSQPNISCLIARLEDVSGFFAVHACQRLPQLSDAPRGTATTSANEVPMLFDLCEDR
jgi:hypothetical protein